MYVLDFLEISPAPNGVYHVCSLAWIAVGIHVQSRTLTHTFEVAHSYRARRCRSDATMSFFCFRSRRSCTT